MPNLMPLRILHISDLHFSSRGAPEVSSPDAKVDNELLTKFAGNRAEAEFLSYFRKLLREKFGTEDHWPKAVILTGDLVDRGGTDGEEYARAVNFIETLAGELKISNDRVFVVPGNHDVDWSPGLSQSQRFEKFFDATRAFTAPGMDSDGVFSPRRVDLRNIREDIPVELTLLVSPTFSGILNPAAKKLEKQLHRIITGLEPDTREQLLGAIGSPEFWDIAVLGGHQREELARFVEEDPNSTIRIAVLHHHLLPDPQIELAQFESVLDAGKVLERLLDFQYDLVLNGHKHNRRLAQYRFRDKSLDVYTAPSLFGRERPGYTILEVNGPNEPAYVALDSYDFLGERTRRDELLRDGRIPAAVTHLAAQIPTETQNRIVVPVLAALSESEHWESTAVQGIFDDAWREIVDAANALRERRMLFRQPRLWKRWENLISALGPGDQIRVVSDNDLGFWTELRRHSSDAKEYAAPLKAFAGNKTRILIMQDDVLVARERAQELVDAVGYMVDDGFRVLLVPDSHVDITVPAAERDFGVLGEIAVYRFLGRERLSRSLAVTLEENGVRKAIRDWEDIAPLYAWDSQPTEGRTEPLAEWLTSFGETVR